MLGPSVVTMYCRRRPRQVCVRFLRVPSAHALRVDPSTLRELAMASSIYPKQYALVFTEAGLIKSLGLKGEHTLSVHDVSGTTFAVRDGGDFILRFVDVIPASIAVDITPKGKTETVTQELP